VGRMIIYLITNKVNGKKYVGLDNSKYGYRWRDHTRHSKTDNPIMLIDRKLKQYGIENFAYEVLYECVNIEELKEKEVYFIKHFNTFCGNGLGYNQTLGGDGCLGFKMPEDRIKRGESHYMFGRKHSEETNRKRSMTMKGKFAGDKNAFKRPEVRKLLSELAKLRTGTKNGNYRHGKRVGITAKYNHNKV
jgi:group I intron endonuclease